MGKNYSNKHSRSDNFANPLDALNKLSGRKQEAHHKLVASIVKEMGVKEDAISDITRLHMEGSRRAKNVRDYAQAVVQGHVESGTIVDKQLLLQEVHHKHLDNFHHYDKDQLLEMFCMMLTEQVMKNV